MRPLFLADHARVGRQQLHQLRIHARIAGHDLALARSLPAALGVAALVYGLVWEARG